MLIFRELNLVRSDFSYGAKIYTGFSRPVTTDLSNANLSNAYLEWAYFHGTCLRGTDFSYASLDNTKFIAVDLSEASNLDLCKHFGPSTLDYRTLMWSRNLPLSFLRGCGFPDIFLNP
ncbi:pentapeptide repeat-containing protein [Candidatus Thiosymbion oneisti]|uniref:pentapeptide repeat-containing protein n=1 Tax=Candidatus Thiosymbion oneisti TaxID=589554 RepID=UPI0034E09203